MSAITNPTMLHALQEEPVLDTDAPGRSAAYRMDRAHVFHSWSAQAQIDPLVVVGGEGARFRDETGKTWLHFLSQLTNPNLGHQHPQLVKAIKDQADKLCTIAPYHANEARSEAARLIAGVAPGDLN